jgi:hypothetical protein
MINQKKKPKAFPYYLPTVMGIVLLALVVFIHFSGILEKGKETVFTSSTLVDAVDIAELSTAEFVYNGIAEKHKTNKNGEELEAVLWRVRYHGTVKAGIENMSDIIFEIDNENKTVKPILPEIVITADPVEKESLSFMPSKVNTTIGDALMLCKTDMKQEAQSSPELMETAKAQLKTTVEALIYPIVNANGYSVIWDDEI